jgi:hypothetical protein
MRVGQMTKKHFETIRERLSADIVGAHNDLDLYTQLRKRLARYPLASQSITSVLAANHERLTQFRNQPTLSSL